jgi:hypothetical protein
MRRALSILTRPVALVALALVVVVTLTDWPLKWTDDFFRNHPIWQGVATSAIIGAFVASVIRAWARDREVQRWERVHGIAYKALAQWVNVCRDELVAMDCGERPFGQGRERSSAASAARDLIDRDPSLAGLPRCDRLVRLADDREWMAQAYISVRHVKDRERGALATWAPIFLASERLTEEVNSIAVLADALEDLQSALHPGYRDASDAMPTGARRVFAELWEEVIITAVAMEEHLNRIGRRDPGHCSAARILLDEDGRGRLDDGLSDDFVNPRLTALQDRLRQEFGNLLEALDHRGAAGHPNEC